MSVFRVGCGVPSVFIGVRGPLPGRGSGEVGSRGKVRMLLAKGPASIS